MGPWHVLGYKYFNAISYQAYTWSTPILLTSGGLRYSLVDVCHSMDCDHWTTLHHCLTSTRKKIYAYANHIQRCLVIHTTYMARARQQRHKTVYRNVRKYIRSSKLFTLIYIVTNVSTVDVKQFWFADYHNIVHIYQKYMKGIPKLTLCIEWHYCKKQNNSPLTSYIK